VNLCQRGANSTARHRRFGGAVAPNFDDASAVGYTHGKAN